MTDRPGEADYLVTVLFHARAQSAEQAVNEARAAINDSLAGKRLPPFTGPWVVHEAHRIKPLNGGD